MPRIRAGLPVVLIIAAVAAPAGAQEVAPIVLDARQSGCIDITAEYMGCLNFGPSAVEVQSTARAGAALSPISAWPKPNATPDERQFAGAATTSFRPVISTPAAFTQSGNVICGACIGHMGAP